MEFSDLPYNTHRVMGYVSNKRQQHDNGGVRDGDAEIEM